MGTKKVVGMVDVLKKNDISDQIVITMDEGDADLDITETTFILFVIQKLDSTTSSITATILDITAGQSYTTFSGNLDIVGRWYVHAAFTISDWIGKTSIACLEAKENF